MSVFKSQFTRSLSVIKSDDADIPYPNNISSGLSTDVSTNYLICDNASFVSQNVATGDVVYNTTTSTAATVVEVVAENTLLLNADIFKDTDNEFIVYQNSSQSTIPSPGCYLYAGSSGNLVVKTVGGDDVSFNSVMAGTVLPVQVTKLKESSTVSDIIALW